MIQKIGGIGFLISSAGIAGQIEMDKSLVLPLVICIASLAMMIVPEILRQVRYEEDHINRGGHSHDASYPSYLCK